MTVREAVEALNARRASAGAGVIDSAREARGVLMMSIEEVKAATRTVLVGLDVDQDELDAAALELVDTGGYMEQAVRAFQMLPPSMHGQLLRSLLAEATVAGYLVAAIQRAAPAEPLEVVPCPQCGSEATEENPATEVAGGMLCADCGCTWRP